MKRVIAAVLILVALVGCLWFAQKLLVPKYIVKNEEGVLAGEYYDNIGSNDVLFIGDCEVYSNFSPITLWQDYGITSVIRGTPQQLIWMSYYMLKDTLRYETPKVVVYNVFSMKYSEPQSEAFNRLALDGMRWSQDKIDAVNASMMGDEHFVDYVFPILRYHYRWSELTSDDFTHFFSKDRVSHNGYYMRCDTRPYTGFPPKPPLLDYTLGANAMSYLSRITKLCKNNNISLVLIKAPIEYPFWYEEWDEQIEAFAAENDIPYINYTGNEEIGIDMSVDTYDAGLHLNLTGAEKMSDYLGSWLHENYDLTDYRCDTEYSQAWQSNIDFYESMKAQQYSEIEQYGELVSFGANATN